MGWTLQFEDGTLIVRGAQLQIFLPSLCGQRIEALEGPDTCIQPLSIKRSETRSHLWMRRAVGKAIGYDTQGAARGS